MREGSRRSDARGRPWAPHRDRDDAVRHFNEWVRHRYYLRAIEEVEAASVKEPEEWSELTGLGLPDAGCAVLARAVALLTPRYGVCRLDDRGRLIPDAPDAWHEDFDRIPGQDALVTNPFGALNNDPVALVRELRVMANDQRRSVLAGAAVLELPPVADAEGELSLGAEYLHKTLDAEVSFIYGLAPGTLAAWKGQYRADLGRKEHGRVPRRPRLIG